MTRDYTEGLEAGVPQRTIDSLRRYIEDRIQPGGFLLAVLTNNLVASFMRADEGNCIALKDIVAWVYHQAPSTCWGSREAVHEWLNGPVE
jgi:hypothetical protein